MNLSQFVSGKTIAVKRVFFDITGSVNAALFLSQVLYWSGSGSAIARDGWFYKTSTEWEREIFLTERMQQVVKKKLVELGLLERKLEGMPAISYYRLNEERLIELLGVEQAKEKEKAVIELKEKEEKKKEERADKAYLSIKKGEEEAKKTKSHPKKTPPSLDEMYKQDIPLVETVIDDESKLSLYIHKNTNTRSLDSNEKKSINKKTTISETRKLKPTAQELGYPIDWRGNALRDELERLIETTFLKVDEIAYMAGNIIRLRASVKRIANWCRISSQKVGDVPSRAFTAMMGIFMHLQRKSEFWGKLPCLPTTMGGSQCLAQCWQLLKQSKQRELEIIEDAKKNYEKSIEFVKFDMGIPDSESNVSFNDYLDFCLERGLKEL